MPSSATERVIPRRDGTWTGALCAVALALAGCQDAPPRAVFADLSFAHMGAFNLDVAAIEIVPAYLPPARSPNVEHLFPVSPLEAAERWARDRLVTAGTSGTARFTITDASVIETRLTPQAGVRGAFTIDQSERYDAVLSVQLSIEREGVTRAVTAANVNHARTVAENITLNQRDAVWFAMTETLLSELNAQLENDIPVYLSDFLR